MASFRPIFAWFSSLIACGPPPSQVSCLYCAPRGLSKIFLVFLKFFQFLISFIILTYCNLTKLLIYLLICYVFIVQWWGTKIGRGIMKIQKF